MPIRCLDVQHTDERLHQPERKSWCQHARELRSTDPQYGNYLRDFRSAGWAKICDKTGKNATWNKICDVDEVRCSTPKPCFKPGYEPEESIDGKLRKFTINARAHTNLRERYLAELKVFLKALKKHKRKLVISSFHLILVGFWWGGLPVWKQNLFRDRAEWFIRDFKSQLIDAFYGRTVYYYTNWWA